MAGNYDELWMPGVPEKNYDGPPFIDGGLRGVGAKIPCPNCDCADTFLVRQKLLDVFEGAPGVASYVGCPACPWRSRALVINQ